MIQRGGKCVKGINRGEEGLNLRQFTTQSELSFPLNACLILYLRSCFDFLCPDCGFFSFFFPSLVADEEWYVVRR